jgi:hypothetical protein
LDARVGRIELFAHEKENKEKRYGILKQLFVAFSSASKLLELAGASTNVIEVHALSREEIQDGGKTVVESKLVLKRSEVVKNEGEENVFSSHVERTPNLIVSSHWLDIMNLSSGDRVMVSNPRGNYEIPPPTTIA